MLALARLSLGTLAVYVLVIDPAIAVNARSGMAARLLGAFMVYGLTAAVVVAFRGNSTALGTVLHMCDLGWAAAITSYTEAPTSVFSVFFIFVLVSAAYRWGLRETLLTGAAITAVLLGQVVAVPAAFADYMDAQHLATDAATRSASRSSSARWRKNSSSRTPRPWRPSASWQPSA